MQKLQAVKVAFTIAIGVFGRAQTIEVAAIKPHAEGTSCSGTELLPGGRLVVGCFTLELIVRESLNVLPSQITGGPEWVRHDLWDITAKTDGVAAGSDSDLVYRNMLRTIAAEHFSLKLRSEKKKGNGFAMVIARKGRLGPALIANRGAPHSFDVKPGASLSARRIRMMELAGWLKWPAGGGRIVTDETGLQGEYDLDLEWTPQPLDQTADATASKNAPTIFTALQDQLGLKIRSEKVIEELYVIEDARRPSLD
jgi:uncharacterized protein (TIGR03435 family)